MPTPEYMNHLYPKFGVKAYHDAGHKGRGISVYIIDTGLAASSTLENVKYRTTATNAKYGHGSFVASILAAKPQERGLFTRQDCHGIAPEAQVYLSDVSNEHGKIYTSALVKAVRDATELRVDILSISMGTDTYDQDLEDAVQKASKLGILIFAAAGNCSCRAYEFPGACDAAISVGSMDTNRKKSAFNTRNDSVAIFAPGQDVFVPGSNSRLSGTSFAVPFASGLAALELCKRRANDPKATLSRSEAIHVLRNALGLSCDEHTYSNDPCHGFSNSFQIHDGSDGLSWFIALAFLSGWLTLWASGRLALLVASARRKNTRIK